jgi:hypothetical protein
VLSAHTTISHSSHDQLTRFSTDSSKVLRYYGMSVATSTATQTGTSTAVRSITNADSPISQLISYITTAFSWFKYSILSFQLLLYWPVPILLYIFAPVIVFSELVVTISFFAPYKSILYLFDALYPLYVLAGVACITGGVLGIAGRGLSRLLVHLLQVRTDETRGKKVNFHV